MKKRLKWLLVGSLMCIGVGSVFHHGYPMKNDDELVVDQTSWKQKAIKSGASQVELKKVKKGFFTCQQIAQGYECWNKFYSVKSSEDVTDEEKLTLLKDAAEKGNERAIWHLLKAYRDGLFGLQEDDPEGLVLAKKYADLRSEKAIDYLLDAHIRGWYGLQENDPEGLKLAIKYAKKGSENAIDHFLKAYAYRLYGDQKYDPEVFKLVATLAIDGNSRALEIFNKHNDKVIPNFKCNDNLVPFSDVDIFFN